MLTLAETMFPAWITIPVAGVTLLVVAAHIIAMHLSSMDSRRRRLRTVAGVLTMLITALLAYAVGVAPATPEHGSPSEARLFVVLWTTIVGLLGALVILALLDALSTLRHANLSSRRLRKQFREQLRVHDGSLPPDIAARIAQVRSGSGSGSDNPGDD